MYTNTFEPDTNLGLRLGINPMYQYPTTIGHLTFGYCHPLKQTTGVLVMEGGGRSEDPLP